MKLNLILLLLGAVFVSSCTVISTSQQSTQATQTQIREFQTRYFDTNDVKLIMKSVLNVLQDDGFIVKNVVVDIGLLTGSKEVDMTRSKNSNNNDFWVNLIQGLSKSNSSDRTTFNKIQQIEVSVNVSEYGKQSKVRANFQAKILDNLGNTVEVKAIDDMKFYQEFFSKVDKGIFLQKHGL